MSDLLHDLQNLDFESYEGFERSILKYALSLAEIMADNRQTRMTWEEFEQLPDTLEYSNGFVEPKHWMFYGVLNERRLSSVRDRITSQLQAFVEARKLGRVAIEGNAIVVRGQADSVLLAVLMKSSREQIERHRRRYQLIHDSFDKSKKIIADFRHRALRHHAEGIFIAETTFGATITLFTGRVIPTRWIGEQHVREDLGFIPSFAHWVKAIRPEPRMGRALRLEASLDRVGHGA